MREVGPPVMVELGSERLTVTVCDCMRPDTHAEKGRKLDCGIVVPLMSTASVPVFTVHDASSLTLMVPTVTSALAAGLGAMNVNAPGAGMASARCADNPRPRATPNAKESLVGRNRIQ